MASSRYPIRFNKLSSFLFRGVLIRPSRCFLELEADNIRAQMDWAFRASFPRSSIARAALGANGMILGLGVHGFAGRWLVNGSLDGLVSVHLRPEQRAFVLGVPIKLRELQLSMEEPEAFLAAVQAPSSQP
jgi:hypothetical protein